MSGAGSSPFASSPFASYTTTTTTEAVGDTYGVDGPLRFPIPAGTTGVIGDPALGKVLAYLKAGINALVSVPWAELRPRAAEADALPVRGTFAHDPHGHDFNPRDLPALFLWRRKESKVQTAEDHRWAGSAWRGMWVFPPDGAGKQRPRAPFINAVAKAIDIALQRVRIPEWFDTGDTTAGSESLDADTDAIKLTFSTPVAPTTYTGAQLSGDLGANEFTPRRGISITTSPAIGAYSTAAPIVVTVVNWLGSEQALEFDLTAVNGGETIEVPEEGGQVVSVYVPGQPLATGTISVGVMARPGRGSSLTARAGLASIQLKEWAPEQLKIHTVDENDRIQDTLTFDALQFDLEVEERHVFDIADPGRFADNDQIEVAVLEDDRVVTEGLWPDNSE